MKKHFDYFFGSSDAQNTTVSAVIFSSRTRMARNACDGSQRAEREVAAQSRGAEPGSRWVHERLTHLSLQPQRVYSSAGTLVTKFRCVRF